MLIETPIPDECLARPRRLTLPDYGSRTVRRTVAAVPLPPYVEDVLEVVEAIPRGRVMSYGDIAEYLERGGPRQVGWVMSRYGGAVPWWRVIRADGAPPPHKTRVALDHYRDEGTPLRPYGDKVDMRRARWDGH